MYDFNIGFLTVHHCHKYELNQNMIQSNKTKKDKKKNKSKLLTGALTWRLKLDFDNDMAFISHFVLGGTQRLS